MKMQESELREMFRNLYSKTTYQRIPEIENDINEVLKVTSTFTTATEMVIKRIGESGEAQEKLILDSFDNLARNVERRLELVAKMKRKIEDVERELTFQQEMVGNYKIDSKRQ